MSFEKENENENENECFICCEEQPFQYHCMQCSKNICFTCFQTIASRRNNKCPFCRAKLPENIFKDRIVEKVIEKVKLIEKVVWKDGKEIIHKDRYIYTNTPRENYMKIKSDRDWKNNFLPQDTQEEIERIVNESINR